MSESHSFSLEAFERLNMTRYFNIAFFAVILLVAGPMANGLTLEERFEQLTNDFVSHFFAIPKLFL
jgi:hypothetical protein